MHCAGHKSGILFDIGKRLFFNKGMLRIFHNSILENNWVLDILKKSCFHCFLGNYSILIVILLQNTLYSFWKVIIGCSGHTSGMLFDVEQYLFYNKGISSIFQNSIFDNK